MKLILPILFLMIIFFSCKNEVNNDNSIDKIEAVNYEPIFLNLSPKMEGMRFYEELNKNPSIDNSFFYIPLNETSDSFKVSKMEDRILLEYSDKRELSATNNPSSVPFYQRQHIHNEKTVQEFIALFKSKYGKPLNLLPFEHNDEGEYFNKEACKWKNAANRNFRKREYANGIVNKTLWDYDFDKCYYLVFQDNSKTIMIGYENSNSNNFGVELEINYFHNSDFLLLQKKMEKDKSEFETAKFNMEKLKKEEQIKNEKNKEKI